MNSILTVRILIYFIRHIKQYVPIRWKQIVNLVFAGSVRDGGVAPFLTDEWNPWEDEQVEYNSVLNKKRETFKQRLERIDKNKPKRHNVQIWGKAAIGKLWWDGNTAFCVVIWVWR